MVEGMAAAGDEAVRVPLESVPEELRDFVHGAIAFGRLLGGDLPGQLERGGGSDPVDGE